MFLMWREYVDIVKIFTGIREFGWNLTEMATQKEIAMQGRTICKDYIYHKLRKMGLLNKKVTLQATAKSSDISFQIQYLGSEMEKNHPDVYKNISRQLAVTMNSEKIVRETFMQVVENIFEDGRITWGRIVSLFPLAGSFSVDCVQQSHGEFVNTVVDAVATVVENKLVGWIQQQGGWIELMLSHRARDKKHLYILSAFGATIGFATTLVVIATWV
ncbi:unnamed protein product [Owenia fusiformis]|uniref:Uncharacterized protein n=1 Tax=Owenia fusiformis TaxID=6347 RepID=A0A8J1UAS3_OWEFU|nr:unnamed protein product [Owenia fusiformis]